MCVWLVATQCSLAWELAPTLTWSWSRQLEEAASACAETRLPQPVPRPAVSLRVLRREAGGLGLSSPTWHSRPGAWGSRSICPGSGELSPGLWAVLCARLGEGAYGCGLPLRSPSLRAGLPLHPPAPVTSMGSALGTHLCLNGEPGRGLAFSEGLKAFARETKGVD